MESIIFQCSNEGLCMKGLIIWSQSNCRSTMALYRELIRNFNVPALITLWHFDKDCNNKDIREKVGFSHDEFLDLPIEPVGADYKKARQIIDSHRGWLHIFCVWQGSPLYQRLIVEAKALGERVGVACESPCNMASGWRKGAKSLYMKFALPYMAKPIIKAADFFVNYSGKDDSAARQLGWPKDKIIPFGYYPPPIIGSRCMKRESNSDFTILATGILSRYRGADILIDALQILKARKIPYRAIITQKGELLEPLKAKAIQYDLPVEFPGFVEMTELIRLYETCSVYVGAGRSEPWGMRLNDALNCGAPLVVSRGMGGVSMVDEYGCGLAFSSGRAEELADCLVSLATDINLYRTCSANAILASEKCSPSYKAGELYTTIKERLLQHDPCR